MVARCLAYFGASKFSIDIDDDIFWTIVFIRISIFRYKIQFSASLARGWSNLTWIMYWVHNFINHNFAIFHTVDQRKSTSSNLCSSIKYRVLSDGFIFYQSSTSINISLKKINPASMPTLFTSNNGSQVTWNKSQRGSTTVLWTMKLSARQHGHRSFIDDTQIDRRDFSSIHLTPGHELSFPDDLVAEQRLGEHVCVVYERAESRRA